MFESGFLPYIHMFVKHVTVFEDSEVLLPPPPPHMHTPPGFVPVEGDPLSSL